MPEKKALERAEIDRKAGKAASTQAGEFVLEEIRPIRRGRHGARSTKQTIASGLSKARRIGIELDPGPHGCILQAESGPIGRKSSQTVP
jgi:hypothetical protein